MSHHKHFEKCKKSDLGKWILLSFWIFVPGFHHFDSCLLSNIDRDDVFPGLYRENIRKKYFLTWFLSEHVILMIKMIIQLCAEDHSWWWRCFFVSGGSSFYVFAYSIFYFVTKLGLVHNFSFTTPKCRKYFKGFFCILEQIIF